MDWKKHIPFIHKRGVADKALIDKEYIEESIDRSPVLTVFIIVLIWMVSAVLLLLSENRQRDLTVWADGQKAPFSVWARTNFSYEDTIATKKARSEAMKKELPVYRIILDNQENIQREFGKFFSALQLRENSENENKHFSPGESVGSRLAAGAVDYRIILQKLKENQHKTVSSLVSLLRHGISGSDASNISPGKKSRIISADGRSYMVTPPDNVQAAGKLAETLDLTGTAREEFIRCAAKLLESGNLKFDKDTTESYAEEAAKKIKPVIKKCSRGDLIVERKHTITREHVDMFNAERAALPRGNGIVLLMNQLILSFLLLLMALFFLYRTYPKIFQTPYRFSIGGTALILSLLANYGAMQLFLYFFRHGILPDYELMLLMVPIPFGTALISILLGNRTALFSGFLVAAITALMILPDRSFELALRWFGIGALMTLFIRDVSNYRSFFVKVFLFGALLTAVVNADVLYSLYTDIRIFKLACVTVLANAFVCALASLLAVFAFELIFNADTSMSLMVLSDYNHPLLEKLKRNAPGTMFHSMTVATLAEDAAKAIKANPLRAKAGALFHDIGKLAMPKYFVENNVNSPKEHQSMPPQISCGIIRGHVKEGLLLAREYRLCKFVREAIASHHGDDLISFFYRRALENSDSENLPVLEEQFRYNETPPAEKELTIISLADACEAASRSLKSPSPAKIEELVNDIFIHRIRGGQLRNSELTLEELDSVRKCFINDLINFNHGRIPYQKEIDDDDTTALPVDEPAASCPEKK